MSSKRKVVYFEADTLDEAQAMLDNKETKKAICEFLGITYNTKRLGTILEDHATQKESEKDLRKKKRLTACDNEELVAIIEDYLSGASFKELSDNYFRSATYIKHRIDMAGGLIRSNAARNPLFAPIFPDDGLNLDADFVGRKQQSFREKTRKEWDAVVLEKQAKNGTLREVVGSGKLPSVQALRKDGELVWVAAYQCLGEIVKQVPTKDDIAYRVFLLDKSMQMYVNIPYWELCSLRHLKELGVTVERMGSYTKNEDITLALNDALKAAKGIKGAKK